MSNTKKKRSTEFTYTQKRCVQIQVAHMPTFQKLGVRMSTLDVGPPNIGPSNIGPPNIGPSN